MVLKKCDGAYKDEDFLKVLGLVNEFEDSQDSESSDDCRQNT